MEGRGGGGAMWCDVRRWEALEEDKGGRGGEDAGWAAYEVGCVVLLGDAWCCVVAGFRRVTIKGVTSSGYSYSTRLLKVLKV